MIILLFFLKFKPIRNLYLDACSIIQIFGNPKKLRMFIWTKCFVSGKNFSLLIHLTSSVWRNWKSYVQINRINFLGLGIYVFNKFYCNSSNNIVKTKLKLKKLTHSTSLWKLNNFPREILRFYTIWGSAIISFF